MLGFGLKIAGAALIVAGFWQAVGLGLARFVPIVGDILSEILMGILTLAGALPIQNPYMVVFIAGALLILWGARLETRDAALQRAGRIQESPSDWHKIIGNVLILISGIPGLCCLAMGALLALKPDLSGLGALARVIQTVLEALLESTKLFLYTFAGGWSIDGGSGRSPSSAYVEIMESVNEWLISPVFWIAFGLGMMAFIGWFIDWVGVDPLFDDDAKPSEDAQEQSLPAS